MRYFVLFLFLFTLLPPQRVTYGQLFGALELGTELNNNFKELEQGLIQPYWMSTRLSAGVIVNRWRMGFSEAAVYTNPGTTFMEGGFLQYGIELIEIEGAKLIDLYLGAEVYKEWLTGRDNVLPVGILASTTIPSVFDLSFRMGYDFEQNRYYAGISIGRNISKHTRPAGDKIPYPMNYTECQYVIFNHTQIPLQTQFFVTPQNPEPVVQERYRRLEQFVHPGNELAFLSQPSSEAALRYLRSTGLPELANAIELGLARSRTQPVCAEDDFLPHRLLPVLWRRLSDSYSLIRDARKYTR